MPQLFRDRMVYSLLLLMLCLSCNNLIAQQGSGCSITVNDGISIESSPRSSQLATSTPYLNHVAWTATGNITLPDNRFVETTLLPAQQSEMLVVNNFGFAIPNESKIWGIEVRFYGDKIGEDTIRDKRIQIVDDAGKLVGKNKFNKAIKGSAWNQDSLNSIGYWLYGSESDLWNVDLTPEMVNNKNFGLAIQIQNIGKAEARILLDQVLIKIYHEPAIDICSEHKCISIFSPPEEDVIDYDWTVSDDLPYQDSTNLSNVINIYTDQANFGSYEVCLTKTYLDGSIESCCRNIIYRDCRKGKIGDYVWEDTNGNGNQDAGEPGLNNIRVFLYNESQQFLEESITSNGGIYSFENLEPGNYFVKVSNYKYCPTIGVGNSENTDSDFLESIAPLFSDLIMLQPGQNIRNVDFGLIRKGTIEGKTWLDIDGDGLIEGSDGIMANIEVQLFNAQNVLHNTTVSDSNGLYRFDAVPPGEYTLAFVFDTIYNSTLKSVDNFINDNFRTDKILLLNGGLLQNVNAGVYRYSRMGDFVWFDENENGIFDADENGISGVPIVLNKCNGTRIVDTVTDSLGYYIFEDLAPGRYEVCLENSRSDIRPSDALTGIASLTLTDTSACVNCLLILENSNIDSLDFAFINAFVPINVNIWYDNNSNGIRDIDEVDADSVLVELYSCSDSLLASAFSNIDGLVIFDNFTIGDYYVIVSPSNGEQFSIESDISNLNGDGSTDCANVVQPGVTFNIGLIQLSSIGDFVWEDVNRNGLQDSNELGIENVIIRLTTCNDSLLLETTTNELGHYSFDKLVAGNYKVCSIFETDDFEPTVFVADSLASNSDIEDAKINTCSSCISIVPNQNITDIDFGYVSTKSTLNISVWSDINFDGFNDMESGLPSVSVELHLCSGQLLRSTKTNIDGLLEMGDLLLREYYLKVIPPQGMIINPNSVFTNANGLNTTDCFLLDPFESYINVPIVILSTIGDYVWLDANMDGIQNGGEQGLANVTVSLQNCDGVLINQVITSQEGQYSFVDLFPGEYTICVDSPGDFFDRTVSDLSQEALNSDFDLSSTQLCSSCFVLEPFEDITDLDFGFIREVGLIDVNVWFDDDGDGLFDIDENGASGVEVSLLTCAGAVLNTLLTDMNGVVLFDEIPFGDYYIQVTESVGMSFSAGTSITDANGSGTSDCVTVTSNGASFTAGYVGPGSIGDYVWFDANENGIQDADEVGVENINLSLLDESGVILASTTTDSRGNYLFDNLYPGQYRILVLGLSESLGITTPKLGTDDTNSDFDDINTLVITPFLTLKSNQSKEDVDLGLVSNISLFAGRVWRDRNGDLIDFDEEGQADITVTLFSCNGDSISQTTTEANGDFIFNDVFRGEYYFRFGAGADYIFGVGGGSSISNVHGSNTTDCITISPVSQETVAISLMPLSNLKTTVFLDKNKNGILESTDPGLEDVTVILRNLADVALGTMQTNVSGEVLFTQITPGKYKLELVIQNPDLSPTLDGQGMENEDSDLLDIGGRLLTDTIEMYDVGLKEDVDLGLIKVDAGIINGLVWRDGNANLTIGNEVRMQDIVMSLFDCDDNFVRSESTLANGTFEFSALPEGDYVVKIENSEDFDIGSGKESEFDISSEGNSPCISIVNNVPVYLEFAYIPLASVGDFIWNDENENGRQDATEVGVGDIEVRLLNQVGAVLETTFSDQMGAYYFDYTRPGIYRLELFGLSGIYDATLKGVGSENLDSELLFEGNRYTSEFFAVFDGVDILNIDLGLIKINEANAPLENEIFVPTKERYSTIYPNPVYGKSFQLEIENKFLDAELSYSIVDMNGKPIRIYKTGLRNEPGLYQYDVATEGLETGIYTVKVNIRNRVEYHKLMILD